MQNNLKHFPSITSFVWLHKHCLLFVVLMDNDIITDYLSLFHFLQCKLCSEVTLLSTLSSINSGQSDFLWPLMDCSTSCSTFEYQISVPATTTKGVIKGLQNVVVLSVPSTMARCKYQRLNIWKLNIQDSLLETWLFNTKCKHCIKKKIRSVGVLECVCVCVKVMSLKRMWLVWCMNVISDLNQSKISLLYVNTVESFT